MADGRKKGEPGRPFYTYVDEKVYETLLGRSLDTIAHSQSIAWGNLMELYVRDHVLGFEYRHYGDEPAKHPKYDFWTGSPDFSKPQFNAISELKCYYPKKFCEYSNAILSKDVLRLKNEFPSEYWQIVSGAIIHGFTYGEAMVFMPPEGELEKVRQYAANFDGPDQWKYRFIFESDNDNIPYVPKESKYAPLNRFMFELPKDDVEALTNRVLLAYEELMKRLKSFDHVSINNIS